MTNDAIETVFNQTTFNNTIAAAKNCQLCASFLRPNPVFVVKPTATLLIVGQAPGSKVDQTGIPWHDASGDRLRSWLSIDRETFYHSDKIAILPAGFCYPGKGKSGDLPPPKICAQTWHQPMLALMPNIQLTLLIGQYAQNYYLGTSKKQNLTATVRAFQEYLPRGFLPLPHPSPLNNLWLKRNEWFATEVLPTLKQWQQQILP